MPEKDSKPELSKKSDRWETWIVVAYAAAMVITAVFAFMSVLEIRRLVYAA